MAEVQADFKFSTDEFTKRIMMGNLGGLDEKMQHAAEQILYSAQEHVRAYLYPGHGYLTGVLWGSYHGEVSGEGNHAYKVHFSTELYYAPFVEYGTYKMSPRIHFRPGTQEAEEEIPDKLKEAVNGFLEGGK